MRVIVDVSKCCGAGQCVLLAPKVFDQQESGVVILLDEAPPKDLQKALREAASVCPTAAMSVEG